GGLGHTDAAHGRLARRVGELDDAGAELCGGCVVDVGVVGELPHDEGGQPFGDRLADAAEADHTACLAQQLDAGELLALPPAGLHRGVGATEVAQRGQDQCDRELGGGGDVRGRRVDDHDAGARGGGDVHVVQAHAG